MFTPVFHRRAGGDRFVPWCADDPDEIGDGRAWWHAVYSGESPITEVDGVHPEHAPAEGVFGVMTSSSTAPDLMADMVCLERCELVTMTSQALAISRGPCGTPILDASGRAPLSEHAVVPSCFRARVTP